ncbi:5'-adenylylsulfate reductase-like 5 [Benincasa hispida]|uniref:5'-adenylylsulfate reductase-like 5 n=1 Tax=Benincasa hispida TaxID=102211 RepID=UPI001901EBDD|nr:5'-adenylylsulfate reductase-like 5 [Benincasa hispida]
MAAFSLFVYFIALCSLGFVSSTSLSRSSFCPKESDFFLYGVRSQCPFSAVPSSPLQVDGDYIDGTLTNYKEVGYTSVLFYASWCPFSLRLRHTFEALSFLFPQIEHVLVEQSSTLPNVLSKYGVHSFPSILLVNGTSRVRYRGQKDILSLVRFYNRITGLKPIPYYSDAELVTIESVGKPVIQLPKFSSTNNILKSEPLLTFSFVFICLRIAIFKLPHMLHQLNNLCRSYMPHLNLEIFGETRQLMGRVLHMLDIRRAWAKLRLYKTKNIHKGARNARVWASSLASVSLGESSSSRST